ASVLLRFKRETQRFRRPLLPQCESRGREKKCGAGFQPAKVLLTQKELSRLKCRRDSGATIFLTTCVSVVKKELTGWERKVTLRAEYPAFARPRSLRVSYSSGDRRVDSAGRLGQDNARPLCTRPRAPR